MHWFNHAAAPRIWRKFLIASKIFVSYNFYKIPILALKEPVVQKL